MKGKKAVLVNAKSLSLTSGGSDAIEKLKKKAAILANADSASLKEKVIAMGGVQSNSAKLAEILEQKTLAIIDGGEEALQAALECANRQTLIVVDAEDGVAFYGLAINSKAGNIDRTVNSGDLALTIATIMDIPIDETCQAAIIYQVLKDPNLKLTEISRLREALARMEAVIERNNREPWDKHDCA